ncbi:hypothetical protein JXA05_01035 [Candidatus Peregrinibacteria bacterium]|nr:hypothetical protein [Candidatus Peregrinibacteria bacterium]
MKKIVYIEVDDEITSVYDRVKRFRQTEIYLVVPRKAILFESGVNLSILKSKLEKLGKILHLVTSDANGRHLAEKIGIAVHRSLEIDEVKAPPEDSPQMRITPIQARRNEVVRDQPRRFTEKKMTIGELIKEFRLREKSGRKKPGHFFSSFHFARPNRKLLALIVLISIGLFMLVSYIALPGATLYIRPKFDNISHSVNVILADKRKNQNLLQQNKAHVIASEEVTVVTKETKMFNTAGKQFEGVNARGKAKIINATEEEWQLKGETRLQTEEGLIFRLKGPVVVPAAVRDPSGTAIPGELSVSVEADPFDALGSPVGERGNIPPSRFILPGLSKYNQAKLWAESVEPMQGGVTKYRKMVRAEDIESAKKQIEENLILMAREELKSRIRDMNALNQTNLALLDDSRYLKTELLDLRVPEDIEGSYREKFEVYAEIKAIGMAYDFDQLFALLKKELRARAHPDMRLRDDSITPETVSYEVIDDDPQNGQIKITATARGIQEFVIDPADTAGKRFSDKVKNKVLGQSVENARNLVANLPEVESVKIEVWPFWASALPRIADNIEIRLMETQ